ncbi:Acyltransferase family protein [compost metagenome]
MERKAKVVASGLCFVGAIWFGSFPYFGGDSGVWRFLPPAPSNAGIFFATTGAFLLVVAVSLSEVSKSILSSGAMRYLGGLSFSVYLVHFPIVMAFSSFVILHAVKHISYGASLAISLSVTLLVVWICSVVFKKVFDDTSVSVSKWIGIKVSKLINASNLSSKEVEKA